MPTPFSAEDLGRIFEARTLTRGRSLVLIGAVEVSLTGETITGTVEDKGVKRTARITPVAQGRRVVFENRCSCRLVNCPHLAATAFAALDRFPALRRATEQASFIDNLAAAPSAEKQRLLVNLEPGMPPDACFVSLSLVGERTARIEPTSPARIIAEGTAGDAAVGLAHLLGAGEKSRNGVPATSVAPLIAVLLRIDNARWGATGKKLIHGEERVFDASQPPRLPRARPSCSAIRAPGMSMPPAARSAASSSASPRPPAPPPITPRPKSLRRPRCQHPGRHRKRTRHCRAPGHPGDAPAAPARAR